MEIIEEQILQYLKRIESKLDNFEGFYNPTKKEVEELNAIEEDINSGNFKTLNDVKKDLGL